MTARAGKYKPLTSKLRAAAARGQETVDLNFDEVGALVGCLPSSATSRQWWANSSHVQALAWCAAGFHVESVSLDHRRVRFSLGSVVGRDTGGHHQGVNAAQPAEPEPSNGSGTPTSVLINERIDVRVHVDWTDGGTVVLDAAGKPAFGPLPAVPGLYQLTFTGQPGQARPRVYIGESDNLRRRLATNYRSPGNGQPTSLRVNAALREHLTGRGTVGLVIATAATVHVSVAGGEPAPSALDLSAKAARLLAENAAIVTAQVAGEVDLENLS